MKVGEVIPGAQARPIPSLDLGNPELQLVTNRRRAAGAVDLCGVTGLDRKVGAK